MYDNFLGGIALVGNGFGLLVCLGKPGIVLQVVLIVDYMKSINALHFMITLYSHKATVAASFSDTL